MDPKQTKQVVRLAIFLIAAVGIFLLIRSLEAVPAALVSFEPEATLMATPDGQERLTAAATGKAGSIELLIALAIAGFVVWKYQSAFVAMVTGVSDRQPTTAAEHLAAMNPMQLPPQARSHFEQVATQAIYENDRKSLIACIRQLNPSFRFTREEATEEAE